MQNDVILDDKLWDDAQKAQPLRQFPNGIIRNSLGQIIRPVAQVTDKYGKGGRPPLNEDEIVQKLKQAFLFGCDDLEACLYAGCSQRWLYNYQEAHREFVQEKEVWKQTPMLEARLTLLAAVTTDPELALKFMERKKKKEFSTRQEVTGADGEAIQQTIKQLNGTAPRTDYDDVSKWAAGSLPTGTDK
jgi:hypothetical protein